MPSEGIAHIEHTQLLTFEEILRIVQAMADMGLKKVRLTGGEPLVRRGVLELVQMLSKHCPTVTLAMTSNGIFLKDYAANLKKAGLSEINISLDTLDPVTFQKLTGFNELHSVKEGILAALDAGLSVKLNCVPIKDYNDQELTKLADYASSIKVPLRFIELMPIGCGKNYEGVSSDDILRLLGDAYAAPVVDAPSNVRPAGPAIYYRFPNLEQRIGLIRPLSDCFCDTCNRVRLTSEGVLKLCLYHADDLQLRDALRKGASREELQFIIEKALLIKPKEHGFLKDLQSKDSRSMHEIGG